jgi:TonB family protein
MKKCSTCQEEFADKFSFCPVDGTPLNALAVQSPTPENIAPAAEARETVSTRLADTFQGRFTEPAPAVVAEEIAAPAPSNGNGKNSAFAVTNENFQQAAAETVRRESAEHAAFAAAASENNAALVKREDELHLTILEEKSLFARLGREVAQVGRDSQLTWPEFKRDPFGFVKRTVSGYGSAAWGVISRPAVGLALLTAVLTIGVMVGGLFLLDSKLSAGGMNKTSVALLAGGALLLLGGLLTAWLKRERPEAVEGVGFTNTRVAESGSSNNDLAAVAAALAFVTLLSGGLYFGSRFLTIRPAQTEQEIELTQLLEPPPTEIPKEEEKPKEGPAGNNKGTGGGSKPKQEKPQGGGGGGDVNETRPTTKGEIPPMSREPQIVVPKPEAPKPPERPVLLPVMPTLKGDEALSRNPKSMQFGDPDSKANEISRGKGDGGGMGGGKGNGAGGGDGDGAGPGRGENTGGGDAKYGGGGPGGGGGGAPKKPEVDENRPYTAKEVTRKAVITFKPEALYTEEARKNAFTGTVNLRILLAANGSVTSISPVSRLPHGLTEQAIAAARKIRFTPAQKDGRNVSQWVQIQYEFNLY